jgi:hypothetical protein
VFYGKTLVLFLHTTTVQEATGEKMAPKPETNVYGLRRKKLCAVHNAQSGPPSGAKNICAVVALPAAQPDNVCHQKHYFWLSAQW